MVTITSFPWHINQFKRSFTSPNTLYILLDEYIVQKRSEENILSLISRILEFPGPHDSNLWLYAILGCSHNHKREEIQKFRSGEIICTLSILQELYKKEIKCSPFVDLVFENKYRFIPRYHKLKTFTIFSKDRKWVIYSMMLAAAISSRIRKFKMFEHFKNILGISAILGGNTEIIRYVHQHHEFENPGEIIYQVYFRGGTKALDISGFDLQDIFSAGRDYKKAELMHYVFEKNPVAAEEKH